MAEKTDTRSRIRSKRAQQRRRNQIMIVGVVAVVAIAITLLLVLASQPNRSAAASFEGLNQTVDENGSLGLAIGPADAPVTLIDYSDFSCPHCYDLAPAIERVIEEYAAAGQVRVIYKPISFVNPPTSVPSAAAAVCAAEQGKGWEMMSEIWALYARGGPNAYSRTLLFDSASKLELDMAAFETCFDAPATLNALQGVLDEATQKGIQGTPTVFVNGTVVAFSASESRYDTLKRAIDAALEQAG